MILRQTQALTGRPIGASVIAMIRDVMHINCPAEKVFDLLSDARNEVHWNSGVSNVRMVTGEPVGEGSRFQVVDKRGQHDVTITVFERPNRVEFLLLDEKMDVDIVISFSETNGVTTVTGQFDARPKGVMKLLFPLLQPLIKRDIAREHRNFIRFCEASD